MTHEIPEETLNSAVQYCIDEYVRLEQHRDMLRDKWFKGLTIEALHIEYNMSETAVKNVIYGIGDKILIRALKMSLAKENSK